MKYIRQLMIIINISFIAEVMEYFIPLPIAASVYGLILMLLGLLTKVIALEKVEETADFLIEIMPIMFVPLLVGVIAEVEALQQMLLPFCVISVGSTILIMAVTGRVSQAILRREHRKGAPQARTACEEGGEER